MVRGPLRGLTRWLFGRQPRVLDYIVIAVIASVIATVIVAVAGGSRDVGSTSAAGAGTHSLLPAPTKTIVQTVAGSTQPVRPAYAASLPFFAPGGDISCSFQHEGAQCSVVSADITFVLPAGGRPAYIQPGLSVSAYAGKEAPYASQRSDGAVSCVIPPESVPAGLTCRNDVSGHGFVASRITSRQRTF
jgi:hypothetical protein